MPYPKRGGVFLFDNNSHPVPPMEEYPLGIDQYGRDILSVMLHGAKFSLGTTIAVALLLVHIIEARFTVGTSSVHRISMHRKTENSDRDN
ncbi:MAG: hypothetical protein K9L66_04550 [Spirochaetaceae bacterium]|nr:hypothetical protein [Spirochaetaceae bacterium]MCF7950922.1 hypothetical protein [Spirochaetaceae bacterium]